MLDILLFCVFGFSNSPDKLPDSNSVRVPKIRTIFGVVGILKLLAGNIVYLFFIWNLIFVMIYMPVSCPSETHVPVFSFLFYFL